MTCYYCSLVALDTSSGTVYYQDGEWTTNKVQATRFNTNLHFSQRMMKVALASKIHSYEIRFESKPQLYLKERNKIGK